MPSINIKWFELEFDHNDYSKSVKKAIERRFREAARAFLRAAIIRVPVQTGQARGSFLNIQRAVKKVAVPISPIKRIPGKTPEIGASQATQPENILKWTKDKLQFHFRTDLNYYNIHEFGLSSKFKTAQAPWRSFEAGRNAFQREIDQLPERIPNMMDFFYQVEITSSGRGVQVGKRIRLRTQKTIRVNDG